MSPLRALYALYLLTFLAVVLVGFVAESLLRPAAAVFGGVGALVGFALATNAFGAADEAAESARGSRWAPPVYTSARANRLAGVAILIVGVGFAMQALFSDSF